MSNQFGNGDALGSERGLARFADGMWGPSLGGSKGLAASSYGSVSSSGDPAAVLGTSSGASSGKTLSGLSSRSPFWKRSIRDPVNDDVDSVAGADDGTDSTALGQPSAKTSNAIGVGDDPWLGFGNERVDSGEGFALANSSPKSVEDPWMGFGNERAGADESLVRPGSTGGAAEDAWMGFGNERATAESPSGTAAATTANQDGDWVHIAPTEATGESGANGSELTPSSGTTASPLGAANAWDRYKPMLGAATDPSALGFDSDSEPPLDPLDPLIVSTLHQPMRFGGPRPSLDPLSAFDLSGDSLSAQVQALTSAMAGFSDFGPGLGSDSITNRSRYDADSMLLAAGLQS